VCDGIVYRQTTPSRDLGSTLVIHVNTVHRINAAQTAERFLSVADVPFRIILSTTIPSEFRPVAAGGSYR
jgi:hypothetical protein